MTPDVALTRNQENLGIRCDAASVDGDDVLGMHTCLACVLLFDRKFALNRNVCDLRTPNRTLIHHTSEADTFATSDGQPFEKLKNKQPSRIDTRTMSTREYIHTPPIPLRHEVHHVH